MDRPSRRRIRNPGVSRFAPTSNVVSDMSARRLILVCLLVSIALTILAMDMGALLANRHEDNRITFHSLTGTWSQYLELRQEWRPRILSNFLASQVAQRVEGLAITDAGRMSIAAAAWTGGWYFLICLALTFFSGKRALYYLFGFFSCFAFGYLPTVNVRVYPWDLPALFIFTSFVLLLKRGFVSPLFVLLPIGMLFKETTIVLCLVFLFLPSPWERRIRDFAVATGLCLLAKMALDVAVGISLPGMSMTTGDETSSNILANLRALVHVDHHFLVNPLLVNAGTLLALFLLPHRDSRVLMLKIVALFFTANLLLFGRITEYRIWFEMIPLALYSLELTCLREAEE